MLLNYARYLEISLYCSVKTSVPGHRYPFLYIYITYT